MSGPVVLDIEFEGAGWGNFSCSFGDRRDRIEDVSCLCNILEEIVHAGLEVALGHRGLISFDLEPGGERYVLDYIIGDNPPRPLRVRRFSFADLWDKAPAEQGELKFEVTGVDRNAFAQAALDLADRVFRERGMDGYCEIWDWLRPFPSRAVEALRAALATAEHISPGQREDADESEAG